MYRSPAFVRPGYRIVVSLVVLGLLATACAAPTAASLTGLASAGALVRQASTQQVYLPGIEPPTLDPGLAQDLASLDVIAQMFDGLVALDPSGNPTGVGASSWTISADGKIGRASCRERV